MQHAHASSAAHTAFLCSGEVWPAHGGSWIGHVLPGVFLLAWGLHWFTSSTWQQLTGANTQRAGAAHHRIVLLPWPLQQMEPALKIVLPLIAIVLEFTLSGTRQLRCPAGSAKAGELDVAHMNSFSHATNYPPIILSGLVDLINAHWVPLPQGVPHFFLSAAFGSSSFLMLSHTKGEPLDALLHQLLGYCMAAVAAAVLAQGAVQSRTASGSQAFGLSAAKSLALIMEGCWFLAITHIMFSTDATWAASHPGDMTRVMFTPVLFTWVFIGACTFLLVAYLGMHMLLAADSPHRSSHCAHVQQGLSAGTRDCQSDSIGGLHGGADSSWSWRSHKPWRYLQLSAAAKQLHSTAGSQAGVSVVAAGDEDFGEGTSGEDSSDASVEMV